METSQSNSLRHKQFV